MTNEAYVPGKFVTRRDTERLMNLAVAGSELMPRWTEFWRRLRCGFLGHTESLWAASEWTDEEGFHRWVRFYVCGRHCGWNLLVQDLKTTAMKIAEDYNTVSGLRDLNLKGGTDEDA